MSKIFIFVLFFAAVVAFGNAAPVVEAESADGVKEPATSPGSIREGESLTRVKRHYERSTGERVKTYAYTTAAGAAIGLIAGPVGAGVGAAAGAAVALVIDLTGT